MFLINTHVNFIFNATQNQYRLYLIFTGSQFHNVDEEPTWTNDYQNSVFNQNTRNQIQENILFSSFLDLMQVSYVSNIHEEQ